MPYPGTMFTLLYLSCNDLNSSDNSLKIDDLMILIFGKNGQVATALKEFFPNDLFLGSDSVDFLQPNLVLQALEKYHPSIIINAAAYTQVDAAETEHNSAITINAKTPKLMADWCARNNALLIHYSTDYVFDGSGDQPWVETDTPCPLNYYGLSKWEGEKGIQASGCKHYIFRVSWVYSPWGKNFKKTILRLSQEKEELKIVADQWGAPTRAEDIAAETKKFIGLYEARSPRNFGIYHLRFNEYMTWHQFALEIVEEGKRLGLPVKTKSILPIPTEAFPTPAKRPKNSRLGTIR